MKKTKNKQRFSKFEIVLSVLLVLALSAIVVLLVTYPKNSSNNDSTATSGVFVNLHSVQFDISSGKLVKRTDDDFNKLNSFVNATGEKDIELGCKSVYYTSMVVSKDKKQVLFAYGCDHPSARMYAVENNGEWSFISPTNQFDEFGIPLCNYVDKYNIDPTIAPVCRDASSLEDIYFNYLKRPTFYQD
jgi:hypothetical protein